MYSGFKRLVYSKIILPFKLFRWKLKFRLLYFFSIITRHCWYGPFTGEFGHLLGHNLPFVAHLYSKGVKINFCGLEIHKPFFVDEKGQPVVSKYISIRDFFSEAAPDCNTADAPADVEAATRQFLADIKKSADLGYKPSK